MNRQDCRNMEGMFKQWIEERKRQGPESQPVRSIRQGPGSQSLLQQQSLAEVQSRGQRKKTLRVDSSNSPCLVTGDVENGALQEVDRHRVVRNNSTCSVA